MDNVMQKNNGLAFIERTKNIAENIAAGEQLWRNIIRLVSPYGALFAAALVISDRLQVTLEFGIGESWIVSFFISAVVIVIIDTGIKSLAIQDTPRLISSVISYLIYLVVITSLSFESGNLATTLLRLSVSLLESVSLLMIGFRTYDELKIDLKIESENEKNKAALDAAILEAEKSRIAIALKNETELLAHETKMAMAVSHAESIAARKIAKQKSAGVMPKQTAQTAQKTAQKTAVGFPDFKNGAEAIRWVYETLSEDQRGHGAAKLTVDILADGGITVGERNAREVIRKMK